VAEVGFAVHIRPGYGDKDFSRQVAFRFLAVLGGRLATPVLEVAQDSGSAEDDFESVTIIASGQLVSDHFY
jgi:hypothetical protein